VARAIAPLVAEASRLFLADLGAPQSTDMVRAVSAWLYQESGGRIIGNNPWNLHSWGGLPGQVGYRYAGPGDRNVATFGTLAAGVKASTSRLVNLSSLYGYGAVVGQARAGSPIGFLDALARSSWSAGHYGGAGPQNRLRSVYASLGGVAPPASAGGAGSGPPPATDLLHEFVATIGRSTSDPIRAQDVKPFLLFLIAHHLLPGGPNDVDFQVIGPIQAARDALNGAVGKPWTGVPATFFAAATAAGDPVGSAIGGAAAALGTALTDAAVGMVVNVAILGSIIGLTYLGLRSIVSAPANIGR
jgi:hypothetical protein